MLIRQVPSSRLVVVTQILGFLVLFRIYFIANLLGTFLRLLVLFSANVCANLSGT